MNALEQMNRIATGGLEPDLTIFLNLEVEDGFCRKQGADLDRLENEGFDFHNKVREGYLSIARRAPQRVKVIDARGSVQDVHRRVRECVDQQLEAYSV